MHLWLPYTQMKTVELPAPVITANGTSIMLADGRILTDGIASWWSTCHGYNHPAIVAAIQAQANTLSHVMLGGLVHSPAVELSHQLCQLLDPSLQHIFFSDSGSVAVEVALKIALQYWHNQGLGHRNQFVFFEGAYHGDTIGAMSVSDMPLLHQRYQSTSSHHCLKIPIDELTQTDFYNFLEQNQNQIAAVIIEPLVQGVAGMRMHPPFAIQNIAKACQNTKTLLIFDEIFTGFGRTGTLFAYEQTGVVPDILCLGKALSGGHISLAATVGSTRVYERFLSHDPSMALMHGPTFMANPIACSAALASLSLFKTTDHLTRAKHLGVWFLHRLQAWQTHPAVRSLRALGAIFALELQPNQVSVATLRRAFNQYPVWIRPLENCIYLTPAFMITEDACEQLATAIDHVLDEVLH